MDEQYTRRDGDDVVSEENTIRRGTLQRNTANKGIKRRGSEHMDNREIRRALPIDRRLIFDETEQSPQSTGSTETGDVEEITP